MNDITALLRLQFFDDSFIAPWRLQANGKPFSGLPAAISTVRMAYPDDIDLHRLAFALLPRLPGKPRTSANLKEDGAFSGLNPLEDAVLSDPWLGMNTEDAVNILWAETDGPDLRERLAAMRDFGIRIPSWTTCGTRGGHIGFIFKDPIVTGKPGRAEADRRMLKKLSLTHSLLITAINGDRAAGLRGMTKNPFHKSWHTEIGNLTPIDLDDLLTGLQAMAKAEGWAAQKRRYKGDREREPSPEGRNCALFDLTRWWTYDRVERDGSAILSKVMEINSSFDRPLSYGEVASVARSITKFMRTRFDARGAGENVQRDNAVLDAFMRLRISHGTAPSQVQVAACAGISVRSVRRSWAKVWAVFVNKWPLSGSSVDAAADVPAKALTEPEIEHENEPVGPQTVPPRTRLVANGPPEDMRFWSKQDRAVYSRHERKSWHKKAAQRGAGSYKLDFGARLHGLFYDRRRELDCFETTLERMTKRWNANPLDGLANMVNADERLRMARLGWASRIKAEYRVYDSIRVKPFNDKRRFRTTKDAVDEFADSICEYSLQMVA